MDRRQQKSRKAILNAFEHLLTQREYHKITVQQIIDEANVGRSTFYAHFETKDELLHEMCTQLFDHVFSSHPEFETSHDFSLYDGDFRTVVTHILYHLRDTGTMLTDLMTGESSGVFLRYFRVYLNQLVYTYLLSGLNQHVRAIPEAFLKNHISGSFVNMVQWWMERGMEERPEDLADHYLAVIEPIFHQP